MEKSGEVVLLNSNRFSFEEFQRNMTGEAERAGLNSEQDIVDLLKQVRRQMWETRHESDHPNLCRDIRGETYIKPYASDCR
jgi:hypothetical protein